MDYNWSNIEMYKRTVIEDYEMEEDNMIFAVDFDGTLSLGEWPEVGPANVGLIDFLNYRRSLGDKLILWTCRSDEALNSAINWCKEQGMHFDAINDNLPEIIEQYGNNSRKISCDYYIDDRALSDIRMMEQFEYVSKRDSA